MNGQLAPTSRPSEPYELTERDRRMLEFEGQWFRYAGAKEEAIRVEFDGMSATRYYQIVQALIVHDASLAYAPMTVKRLRRLRDQRRRSRTAPGR
jgi:hypothetical protein